jgi:hypothetical protein
MQTTLERKATRREPEFIAQVSASSPPPEPATREMIAQRAYEIWQRHGCPCDTAFQDWLAAEAELRSHRV